MMMPVVNPGEVWMIDFGMTAKVRPALLLFELNLLIPLLNTVLPAVGAGRVMHAWTWNPPFSENCLEHEAMNADVSVTERV
jgi:hypothetical protein